MSRRVRVFRVNVSFDRGRALSSRPIPPRRGISENSLRGSVICIFHSISLTEASASVRRFYRWNFPATGNSTWKFRLSFARVITLCIAFSIVISQLCARIVGTVATGKSDLFFIYQTDCSQARPFCLVVCNVRLEDVSRSKREIERKREGGRRGLMKCWNRLIERRTTPKRIQWRIALWGLSVNKPCRTRSLIPTSIMSSRSGPRVFALELTSGGHLLPITRDRPLSCFLQFHNQDGSSFRNEIFAGSTPSLFLNTD